MNAPARTVADAAEIELEPAVEHLRAIGRWILDLKGIERITALIAWVRSPWFIGAGMLMDDWLGALHREAWRVFKRTMQSDLPSMIWARAPYATGRAAICRALRIDRAEPTQPFATWPFRIVSTDEGSWIAGAVGCPEINHAHATDPLPELDITDVILWNPRSGATAILGEQAPHAVTPQRLGERLTVYADGYAFFRAWAEIRAERAQMTIAARKGQWAHPVTAAGDSGIPGAFITGPVERARIPLDVAVLEAGPCVDPALLTKAIYRQANLPRVQSMPASGQ